MSSSIDFALVAVNRARDLVDYNIYVNIHKQHEYVKQKILEDNSLTKKEKTEAIRIENNSYDRDKINNNSGTKRICESCNQECLATFYCECCIRNHLRIKFSNWTSGNADIDNLIQKCQMETILPNTIIEWIPYDRIKNIKFLTKGGYSEIYKAVWIDGSYDKWDSKKQQLKRFGRVNVILKTLGNVESENQRWFEEAKSHLTISNRDLSIVRCYGLTQNTSDGNYMLVIRKMDMDLRKYLHQNHNQLTWEERVQITYDIIIALYHIHGENAIHRDLHSKNILYIHYFQKFYISDLGFCGPANRPSKSIYGNLPYIAPEVISGKEYTFESDIYSFAMLMWEISSGQPPFINYEHDYDLAMKIINGIRPKIVPGTPLEYKNLIEQCWDADPLKRPDVYTLYREIRKINISYQNNPSKLVTNNNLKINKSNSLKSKDTNNLLYTSKLHQFETLPEPRNATEAFHSTPYDFEIPDNSK
ncbi:Ipl1p [Rhizophagus irregularis DAOM 197198w]|uniref:Ipl1p n=2 Tax=Rhizophagus irregularis TaxID=588596 RepID=A0A015LW64_RHIIW|nr:Ipl1p [Rhizophagus irregularis DAOM 197198w]